MKWFDLDPTEHDGVIAVLEIDEPEIELHIFGDGRAAWLDVDGNVIREMMPAST